MDYIFRYENWKAFEVMPPLHGDCDDDCPDCLFPVNVLSFDLGESNKLKKEVLAFCNVCQKEVKFFVAFD